MAALAQKQTLVQPERNGASSRIFGHCDISRDTIPVAKRAQPSHNVSDDQE